MTGSSWCGSLVLFGLWCKFFTHCHVFPLNNLDRHPYLCVSDLSSCCQHLLDLPVECDRPKVAPTHTCAIHQNHWHQHAIRYGQQSFLGIRQLIRCSEEERVEWLPQRNRQVQPHDECHKVGKITILYLLVFIVWKPSVLHVVLCMLGHCLTKLNLQHISCIYWIVYIKH